MGQPFLEMLQAADLVESGIHLVVVEQAALADDLPLLGKHALYVIRRQAAIADQRLGEDIFRPR